MVFLLFYLSWILCAVTSPASPNTMRKHPPSSINNKSCRPSSPPPHKHVFFSSHIAQTMQGCRRSRAVDDNNRRGTTTVADGGVTGRYRWRRRSRYVDVDVNDASEANNGIPGRRTGATDAGDQTGAACGRQRVSRGCRCRWPCGTPPRLVCCYSCYWCCCCWC